MSRPLHIRAPGKLVLVGEYAVLDGCVGVVTAVDRFARASAFAASRDAPASCTLSSPALDLVGAVITRGAHGPLTCPDPQWSSPRAELVRALLDAAWPGPEAPPALHLELDTRAFASDLDPGRKLGLGSSAAVAVALAALTQKLGAPDAPIDPQAIFADALAAHVASQRGAGSGIDLAASTWGGTLAYRRPASPRLRPSELRRLDWPDGLELLVVDTGRATSTTDLIDHVRRRRDEPTTARALAKLGETSDHAVAALARADRRAFLQLVGAYGRGMAELGAACSVDIVSEAHRAAERVVTLGGGVYKPSGAGGGDVGIAFATSTAQRDALARDLERAGFDLLAVRPGAAGVAFARESTHDV